MDYGELLIREYVTRHEQKYGTDSLYRESLEKMGQIDLGSINEEVVEGIVEPFLYEWGRMGRVLVDPSSGTGTVILQSRFDPTIRCLQTCGVDAWWKSALVNSNQT